MQAGNLSRASLSQTSFSDPTAKRQDGAGGRARREGEANNVELPTDSQLSAVVP